MRPAQLADFVRRPGPITPRLNTEQLYGIFCREVLRTMVFCRQCGQKVEDCPHFVYPIQSPRVRVYDEKVETISYNEQQRILEIAFKTGQVWQLLDVPPGIYQELRGAPISSFLKFIAQRYKSAPVKTGMRAIIVPDGEVCTKCKSAMKQAHRINNTFDEE